VPSLQRLTSNYDLQQQPLSDFGSTKPRCGLMLLASSLGDGNDAAVAAYCPVMPQQALLAAWCLVNAQPHDQKKLRTQMYTSHSHVHTIVLPLPYFDDTF